MFYQFAPGSAFNTADVDAEGHEEKVISTLCQPVPLISLEFKFPQMYNALAGCVSRIDALGSYRFNAAIAEPPVKLEFTPWLSGAKVIGAIKPSGWRYSERFSLLNTDSARERTHAGIQFVDRDDVLHADKLRRQ